MRLKSGFGKIPRTNTSTINGTNVAVSLAFEVQEMVSMGGCRGPEYDSLHEPEHICGSQDDAQCGKGRNKLTPDKRTRQDQKFADKLLVPGSPNEDKAKSSEKWRNAAWGRPVRCCRESGGCGSVHR